MPLMMATTASTQDKSAPKDHGDDENNARQRDDDSRKPKRPAASVPPALPVWRLGCCTGLACCAG
jgi:hypothetical protein